MELRHIRYFLAVADEMNFTKAAAKLNIAQPPLSRQIQDLEAELGVKLFNRKPHLLELTEEGVFFKEYANRVIHIVERATDDIREMHDGLQGMLYLASVEGHGPHMFAQWISAFSKAYPRVEYNLWNGSTDDVVNRISKGLCEFGIITEPYNGEGLEAIQIYKEPWVAIISKEHPLATKKKETLTFRELAPYDLIIPNRQARTPEIKKWFTTAGCEAKIKCKIAHTLSAYELTKQGVGIAIYPESIKDSIDKTEVCTKRLTKPDVYASYLLVWDKNRPLSKVANEFLNMVRDTLEVL